MTTTRCTPDNAAQFQAMVKADPQLHALVQSLQAQGMFPGLRALSLTTTGPNAQQTNPLAAWAAQAAPQNPATAPKQATASQPTGQAQ